MPELLGAQGGVCRNFWRLRGGYAGTFEDLGGVCRNFLWAFEGLGGGMPEPLAAQGGVCRNFGGSGGGMPELLRT